MSADHSQGNRILYLAQEFSLPLLLGVVVAIAFANVSPEAYDMVVNRTYALVLPDQPAEDPHAGTTPEPHRESGESEYLNSDGQESKKDSSSDQEEHADHENGEAGHGDHGHGDHGHASGWRHYATLHFLINDIFMVLFFGIAAKEIAESCLPGGALNPVSKAVNPLMGTLGGVLGPVGVYLLLNSMIGDAKWVNGWGIPTATDIALAWLIARIVFGTGHPAISFLLLLAVADDGIGLMIIAFKYPTAPPVWVNALWVIPGMLVAFGLRMKKVQAWSPYILIGGALSWWGLYSAHLHPALALVPIVPFLPGPAYDEGLFQDDTSTKETDTLNRFEHDLKPYVDYGLFFFAFANAGVQFASMSNLTWIVLLSLLVGKTVGITFFSWAATLVGFPLPDGMKMKHLLVAGVIAGLGLTVALFVAQQAFPGDSLASFRGASKMGALFSGGIALLAIVLGRMLGVKDGGSGTDGSGDSPTEA